MREYYQVPVVEVTREIDDARLLVLDVSPLAATFGEPGPASSTVRVPSDRFGSVGRCDSPCRLPLTGMAGPITVKSDGRGVRVELDRDDRSRAERC